MPTRTGYRAEAPRRDAAPRVRPTARPAGLLGMQSTAGNRAVASLFVQRECGCGCGGGGGCSTGSAAQAEEMPESEDSAEPVQRAADGRVLQRADLNVFGSGYDQPKEMKSDAAQIKGSQQKGGSGLEWFPASEDFKATAAGGPGAGTFAALLTALKAQAVGSVTVLRMIGHATSGGGGVLALTGEIVAPPSANVNFTGTDDVSTTTVASHAATIAGLKDRFAADGRIIIVGCNAGSADSLMLALATAFNVCVEGFSDEVTWCLNFNSAKTKINSRGATNSKVPNDPLESRTACGPVTSLTPDKKTCPPKPDKPKQECVPIGDLLGGGGPAPDLGGVLSSLQLLVVNGQSDLVGLRHGDGLSFGTFDRRERVRHLQQALNDAGASLAADGMYGDGTQSALDGFRSQRGLTPAADVDRATADSLESGATPGQSDLVGLRRGDGLDFGTEGRKPRVAKLQGKLTEHGHPCKVDGMFGPLTGNALTTFQAVHGLPPEERVDGPTADALEGGTRPPDVCPLGTVPVSA